MYYAELNYKKYDAVLVTEIKTNRGGITYEHEHLLALDLDQVKRKAKQENAELIHVTLKELNHV